MARCPDPRPLHDAPRGRPGDLRRDDLPDLRRRGGPPPRRDRRAAPDPRPAGHGLVAGRAAVRQSQPANDVFEMADRLVVDGSALARHRAAAAPPDGGAPGAPADRDLATSPWSASPAGARRSPSIFDIPDFLPYLRHLRRIAVTYGVRDEVGRRDRRMSSSPSTTSAWLASRLGMRVVKPLAPVHRAIGRKRPSAAGRARTPLAGAGRRPRGDPPARPDRRRGRHSPGPVGDAAGHDAPDRALADWRGSELRADVTAEQEAVHARVWQDGVHALERGFNAPRRTDIDLLAEAIEAGGATIAVARRGGASWRAELAGGPLPMTEPTIVRRARGRGHARRRARARRRPNGSRRSSTTRSTAAWPGPLGDHGRLDAGRRSTATSPTRRCATRSTGRRSTCGGATSGSCPATIRSRTSRSPTTSS